MQTRLSVAVASRDHGEADHNVLLDFAWAALGGSVILAGYALLLTLAVTWGGLLLATPLPDGSVAGISTSYPSLASAFMPGFLVVLVARSLRADRR